MKFLALFLIVLIAHPVAVFPPFVKEGSLAEMLVRCAAMAVVGVCLGVGLGLTLFDLLW